MLTIGKFIEFLLAHFGDIQGVIDLVARLRADFADTDPVTDEVIDIAHAMLAPVPPVGEPPVTTPEG